jgi:hypothetical protein
MARLILGGRPALRDTADVSLGDTADVSLGDTVVAG